MPTYFSANIQAHIDQLWVYPIKSCAGISVPRAELTLSGLRWDRHWMVIGKSGDFVTQRELPRMALIQTNLKDNGCALSAPGIAPMHVSFEAEGPSIAVRVWDNEVHAFDMGETAAQWFSNFLGPTAPAHLQQLRLVRFDPRSHRKCSAKWTGGREAMTQFSDGFSLLVTNTASLAQLNERLQQSGHAPVTMNRFRPNIVLAGMHAHDEDRIGPWKIATKGKGIMLENVKPCARCPIPNIDPFTAQTSPAVGDTLQTYRQDHRLNGAVTFGMNAIPVGGIGEVLEVGQNLTSDWQFD